jgi:hypothetical protein
MADAPGEAGAAPSAGQRQRIGWRARCSAILSYQSRTNSNLDAGRLR